MEHLQILGKGLYIVLPDGGVTAEMDPHTAEAAGAMHLPAVLGERLLAAL